MAYKHIFFDLDHTLWDFETNAKETLFDLFELNEMQSKGVHDFDNFFERYSYHNECLWTSFTNGLIKQQELRWKRVWLALLDFKINDEALAHLMAFQFLERLPYKKKLFPYTIEILNYLKEKGYQLHLVTNGFEAVQQGKLQSSKLHNYFVEIITSETSNYLKPQKEIFEYAIKKCCGLKHECIMVGDNLDADIQGAINAGLDTVFVNHIALQNPHVAATYIVSCLKELEYIF